MKKVMLVFGTRPEAVKMCPLIIELKKFKDIETTVCVTGQHAELLSDAMSDFSVKPDHDLGIMADCRGLFDITEKTMSGVRALISEERPELLVVHGDTTSALSAALAAFYLSVPVAHVEAGLRTGDPLSPFPEEFNRRAIDALASYCFAPTEECVENLLRERGGGKGVYLTGNTVIDAVRIMLGSSGPDFAGLNGYRTITVTAHRRENLGRKMEGMLRAVRRIIENNGDVRAVFPMHPNPAVRAAARRVFDGCPRISLTEPMHTGDFHRLLARSSLIMTDSGGIQEEGAILGVPVIVMRDSTERIKEEKNGDVIVAGTDEDEIYKVASYYLALSSPKARRKMPETTSDSSPSRKIAELIRSAVTCDGKNEKKYPQDIDNLKFI